MYVSVKGSFYIITIVDRSKIPYSLYWTMYHHTYDVSNRGHINNIVFLQWTKMPWANGALSDCDTMLKINHSLHSMANKHYVLCTCR